MMPVRVQRSRRKGSRLISPNGLPVVCVTRGTKWGNPWKVGPKFGGLRDDCVKYFRAWIEQTEPGRKLADDAARELRGKNLACWCPAGQPCHADVLLEIANPPEPAMFLNDLHNCRKPDCDRLTTADYCCGPCASADKGKYEIHESGPLAHADGCNERYAVRSRAEQMLARRHRNHAKLARVSRRNRP